jgi:hypothetical protein
VRYTTRQRDKRVGQPSRVLAHHPLLELAEYSTLHQVMAGVQAATSADVQRLFLQAMLSRRAVPGPLAKLIWKKCIEAVRGMWIGLICLLIALSNNCLAANPSIEIRYSDQPAAWDAFVAALKQAITGLDLEFRTFTDEVNGTPVYALVLFLHPLLRLKVTKAMIGERT